MGVTWCCGCENGRVRAVLGHLPAEGGDELSSWFGGACGTPGTAKSATRDAGGYAAPPRRGRQAPAAARHWAGAGGKACYFSSRWFLFSLPDVVGSSGFVDVVVLRGGGRLGAYFCVRAFCFSDLSSSAIRSWNSALRRKAVMSLMRTFSLGSMSRSSWVLTWRILSIRAL